VRIETRDDLQAAIERLTSRAPASLARFIASLAFDIGPIGEQVRTFIVGDNLAETITSLNERIEALRTSSRRHSRRGGLDQEVGQRLDYILDAIETLVLPMSPEKAFELLVLAIERDGDAMEQCGDDGFSIETAVERAADLLAEAAKSLPSRDVKTTLQRLIAEDGYGTRTPLTALATRYAAK
jgi:hypothetical protein